LTFSSVCLVVLSRTRLAGEKIKIGGLELNTLKKLNGDKLDFPDALSVLANAMGAAPRRFAGKLAVARVSGLWARNWA
jgi:hypothetical protein